MGASFIFAFQLLLIGLIGTLGYVGISSTVAGLGLFVFVVVMVLLFAGPRFPDTSPNAGRRA